jgi:AcrR family transcriptional regulator
MAEHSGVTEGSVSVGGEDTRQSLILAGLKLFGARGFDGASVREIASEAKANIAAIGYHFGGKEGLRTACAEFVAEAIRSLASKAVGSELDVAAVRSPLEAREILHRFLRRLVPFLLADGRARLMMHFMLREINNRSVAFDIVYAGVMEPTHRRLCRLFAKATGRDGESEEVRLAVFTVIGQVLYFRLGQEIVLRRMAWPEYGAREADAVSAMIAANLDSMIDRHTRAEIDGGANR